jgi:hypothetical protein
MRYALINRITNKVDNIIIWDGTASVLNMEIYIPLLLNEGEECSIGYSYDENFEPRLFSNDFFSITF